MPSVISEYRKRLAAEYTKKIVELKDQLLYYEALLAGAQDVADCGVTDISSEKTIDSYLLCGGGELEPGTQAEGVVAAQADNPESELEPPVRLPNDEEMDELRAFKIRTQQQVISSLAAARQGSHFGQHAVDTWDVSILAEVVEAKNEEVARDIIAFRSGRNSREIDIQCVSGVRFLAKRDPRVIEEIRKDAEKEQDDPFHDPPKAIAGSARQSLKLQ